MSFTVHSLPGVIRTECIHALTCPFTAHVLRAVTVVVIETVTHPTLPSPARVFPSLIDIDSTTFEHVNCLTAPLT